MRSVNPPNWVFRQDEYLGHTLPSVKNVATTVLTQAEERELQANRIAARGMRSSAKSGKGLCTANY